MADNGNSHEFTLATRPESARSARSRVRTWLDSANWPPLLIDDIVYAVNEAVTNVLEHAYTSCETTQTVGLTFRIEHGIDGTRRARIHVSDHGRWRPPPPSPGFRGHGLRLMHALMDEVTIQPAAGHHGGTVTTLLSPPVPGY